MGFCLPFSLAPPSNVKSPTKAQAEQWNEQRASAIDYLHEKRKVWGDAKTSNIMVTDDGRAEGRPVRLGRGHDERFHVKGTAHDGRWRSQRPCRHL